MLGQAYAAEGHQQPRALPHALRQALHPRRVLQQVPAPPAAEPVRSQAELDQGACCSTCCTCLETCQHSHCTFPQLRHITANGLVPLATAEQLEGLAACMQTRCAPRRAPRAAARR